MTNVKKLEAELCDMLAEMMRPFVGRHAGYSVLSQIRETLERICLDVAGKYDGEPRAGRDYQVDVVADEKDRGRVICTVRPLSPLGEQFVADLNAKMDAARAAEER